LEPNNETAWTRFICAGVYEINVVMPEPPVALADQGVGQSGQYILYYAEAATQ